jgi:hypothetical protein
LNGQALPQGASHHKKRHGGQHQNRADPDAPIAVHASPIGMVDVLARGIFKSVVIVVRLAHGLIPVLMFAYSIT